MCEIDAEAGFGKKAGENSLQSCFIAMMDRAIELADHFDCDCGHAAVTGATVSDPTCANAVNAAIKDALGAYPIIVFQEACEPPGNIHECFVGTEQFTCSVTVPKSLWDWAKQATDPEDRFKTRRTIRVTFTLRIRLLNVGKGYVMSIGPPPGASPLAVLSAQRRRKPGRLCACGPACGCKVPSPDVAFRVASAVSHTGPIELHTPDDAFWFDAHYNSDRPLPTGLVAHMARRAGETRFE